MLVQRSSEGGCKYEQSLNSLQWPVEELIISFNR
jgi:hypothetical protein